MKQKILIIANRSLPMEYGAEALPGRIHIVPRGELVNKEAGVTQVLDDKSLESILADLKNRHALKGGLYMGEEHFIYNSDKSSEAFAWGKEFGLDDKGIWATAYEPTDVGEPAIKNKRFKFTSFVADPATPGAIENLGGGKIRVLKIDTVGFTNFANGKSLLTPITNKDFADPDGLAERNETQIKNTMKNIATELGLDANTDEAGILSAVRLLKNRGDITPDALKTLREEHNKFRDGNQTLLGEQLDGLLAEHKVTDAKIVNRLKPILSPLANRADRIACLVELGFKPEAAKPAPQTRVLNRGGAASQQSATDAAQTEQERCSKIQSGMSVIRNRDKCSVDHALATLRAEKPELFPAAENAS